MRKNPDKVVLTYPIYSSVMRSAGISELERLQ
jgi:hypothetical protein